MQQMIVFATLGLAFVLFLKSKIRYDMVALIALFIVILTQVISAREGFLGFGHPAVITVVAVMIISKGLQNSGLIDFIANQLLGLGKNFTVMILALCVLTAFASAFMNNVGALAIMMPIALQLARKRDIRVSHILMPLAFSSLLGGMMTMIGTPPNIIIATFRADETGVPFSMFDFMPVGIVLAMAGVLFISLLGWRLIPKRKNQDSSAASFEIEDYITEIRITEDSKILGETMRSIGKDESYYITVIGLIRNNMRIHIPSLDETLTAEDILIVEADSENLKSFLDVTKAELVEDKKFRDSAFGTKEIAIREVVVMQDSTLVGRTPIQLRLRNRFGINVLALSRGTRKFTQRLNKTVFRAGDVLLIQGFESRLDDITDRIGCLPLSGKEHRLGDKSRILLTLSIFFVAIAAIMLKLLAVQIAFCLAALLMVLLKIISVKEVYKSVDWSVVVLLGAMIPVGMALEQTGGADTIAGLILGLGHGIPLWLVLTVLMTITMVLSNVINNAATAVIMAPIGIQLARGLGSPIDPFLMAVAISASAPFLTPIGHQSNTLVMGPGGYKFSDYWKLGLPVQLLVIAVSIPLLIRIWGG
ncbi:MAG: SLC13 family permease [Candidatus Cloacimonadaceae bacterium]